MSRERAGSELGRRASGRKHVTLRVALGAGLLILAVHACAQNRLVARPDVSPPLAKNAPEAAAEQAAASDPDAGAQLTQAEQIDHALSRAAFGVRESERTRVAAIGVSGYLEEQLHPETIDDALLEQRLSGLSSLHESTKERVQELAAFTKKRREDKQEKAREEAARQSAESAGGSDAGAPMQAAMVDVGETGSGSGSENNLNANGQAVDGQAVDRTAANDPAMDKPRKKGRRDLGKIGRGPGFDFTVALAEAKVLRAVYSKRQLLEVMSDFWFNHFNVFAGKDREAALLPAYENDTIRAHALGSFKDLLLATAHSPAMLIYLDNWRSTAAAVDTHPGRARRGFATSEEKEAKGKKGRGLNENYARELLELHTLGVDGGYTQADVTEVARCFTGWSVSDPATDPQFVFKPRVHDRGEKHVLGQTIAAGGGESDADQVLDILLKHPSTARFISRKLVRRFVSDDPPPELVARVAETYLKTGGDIRSMLRTIFASPEFWSRRALRTKMRSPLELVAASSRALDANIDDAFALVRQMARIGEPLFAYAPPTGYGDIASVWASSGALLARIDFGLALAAGQVDGVNIDLAPLTQGARAPDEVLARATRQLGAPELSETTRNYILDQLRDLSLEKRPELVAERAVGLLLGAPELQRR